MYQASTFVSKEQAYQELSQELKLILAEETDEILIMSTLCAMLKDRLPYFFWVGFYRVNPERENSLFIGPYQGTLGCLHIGFGQGICGKAARLQEIQLIDDVNAAPEHIACDSRSASEIVLPVFKNGELIAVLDVDALEKAAFDQTDKKYLNEILLNHFK